MAHKFLTDSGNNSQCHHKRFTVEITLNHATKIKNNKKNQGGGGGGGVYDVVTMYN